MVVRSGSSVHHHYGLVVPEVERAGRVRADCGSSAALRPSMGHSPPSESDVPFCSHSSLNYWSSATTHLPGAPTTPLAAVTGGQD